LRNLIKNIKEIISNNMFDRLDKVDKRYSELETLLASPEVAKNQTQFQSYAKELARISELVKTYREYKENEDTLKSSLEAIEMETDDEMKSLYSDEISLCKENQKRLIDALENCLLDEEDPNKSKDILWKLELVLVEKKRLYLLLIFLGCIVNMLLVRDCVLM